MSLLQSYGIISQKRIFFTVFQTSTNASKQKIFVQINLAHYTTKALRRHTYLYFIGKFKF